MSVVIREANTVFAQRHQSALEQTVDSPAIEVRDAGHWNPSSVLPCYTLPPSTRRDVLDVIEDAALRY